MTDRELLELAAKAVGALDTAPVSTGWSGFQYLGVMWDEDGFYEGWNPLTNDGDAFRLMTDLSLHIGPDFEEVDAYAESGRCATETWDEHQGDKRAATRRAIVRAAAEVGRANSVEQGGDKP